MGGSGGAFVFGHTSFGRVKRHQNSSLASICASCGRRRWTARAEASRPVSTPSSGVPPSQDSSGPAYQTVEETFGTDAGRDLFFSGMNAEMAIKILRTPAALLTDSSDRYVAAERLKFYPSEETTAALLMCVRSTDSRSGSAAERTFADKVARRKSVETLGRFKGQFQREAVIEALRGCLSDPDHYTVEVAVWCLGELQVDDRPNILQEITAILERGEVNQRVIIQTLTKLRHSPALDEIKAHIYSKDAATACAAMAAAARLGGQHESLAGVVDILKSQDLGVRRAALEDIMLCEYYPAIPTVQETPNSLVLRSRTIRKLLDASVPEGRLKWDAYLEERIDRLLWDHPKDLDLLGVRNDTRKSRNIDRNVKRLYKNDALYSYLAARTLGEDHRDSPEGEAGQAVLKSFKEHPYFDYFAAYHVFKTLGWLRHHDAYELLLENLLTLPPRFFNHQVGAATALAEIGKPDAIEALGKIGRSTRIWELKYACMMSAERLGDRGKLRMSFIDDEDWLIAERARSERGFGHLRSSFA